MDGGNTPPPRPGRFELHALAGLPRELAIARLPPGRHGLPRDVVASNQRLRIVAAMLRMLTEYGYPGTTIGHLTSEAGVSKAAFYSHFTDKEECFLETQDLANRWFCERLEEAVATQRQWQDRIRVGVAEALALLAANPPVANLMAIEVLRVSRSARARHEDLQAQVAAIFRAGHPGRPGLPDDLADLLLGGVVSLIARYVDTGRTEQLPEATRVLVECLLIPYLGGEEASAVARGLPGSGG